MKIDDMKEWCLLAYRVLSNLPGRVGPSTKTTYWPECQFERGKDYAGEESRYRPTPTSVEIQSAEKFVDLVNRRLGEEQRRKIWEWAFLKDRFGRMKRHCENLGLTNHEYNRQITAIFQRLGAVVDARPKSARSRRVDNSRIEGEKTAQSEIVRSGTVVAWRPTSSKPVPNGALAHSMERFKKSAPAA